MFTEVPSTTGVLIHYTTSEKPWNYNYKKSDYATDFYNYLKLIKNYERLTFYKNCHENRL